MVRAVIFLPAGHPLDGLYVKQCLDHLLNQGYQLFTIAREWPLVWSLLAAGKVDVVVFARREHWQAEWLPRFEFVPEESTHHPRPMVRRNQGRVYGRPRKEDRPRVVRPQLSDE